MAFAVEGVIRYSAMGGAACEGFAEDQIARYGRDNANTSYAWVAVYTLKFIDGNLKHDASAKAFLMKTPAQNGVPKHFMSIRFRPAQKTSDSSSR